MPPASASIPETLRTAVILTALENEYQQVKALLTDLKITTGKISKRGYREGRVSRNPDGSGGNAPWRVLIHEGGRDQMKALRATEDAIRDWSPDVILFVGCAGGRPKKTRHFEVLVAREVAYYEIGKVTPDGTRHWLKTEELESSCLYEAAKIERDEQDGEGLPAWTERLKCSSLGNWLYANDIITDLTARMAPIASGEKVVTDPASDVWREVETAAYRVEAVETEGYGFCFARCDSLDDRRTPRLMVRGISDMLGDKNLSQEEARTLDNKRPAYLDGMEDHDRQRIASAAAAAFALQVLVRYGELYLDGIPNEAVPQIGPDKLVIKLYGDDFALQQRQLNHLRSFITSLGARTIELELRPGSLIATLHADPAAVALLQALQDAGLLNAITGVQTELLSAPPVDPTALSDDIAAAAAAITGLGADDQAGRDEAADKLEALVQWHPSWRPAATVLLRIAGITPIEIKVTGQHELESLVPPTRPLALVCQGDIKNLLPIANLTNLSSLDISGTQVASLKHIAKLTNLSSLDISGTQVADLKHIAQMTNLSHLNIGNTPIVSLQPIAGMINLSSLNARNTQISSLAPIARLTNLSSLDVGDTQINTLKPAAKLTNLSSLNLSNTQIASLQPITALTNLSHLNIRNTQVTSLQPITALTNLSHLNIRNTRVTNLQPIAALANLAHLDARSTQVASLQPITGLINLSYLNVSGTQVTSLQPIANLPLASLALPNGKTLEGKKLRDYLTSLGS